jgi:sporulation protein YlmC with PRC-barrel domain
MTDINLGASVQCSDGPCGEATNVIVNPINKKVTHIVVEDKKLPDNPTRIVPIGKVMEATQAQINLSCTINDVALMPAFEITRYVQQTARGKALISCHDYFFPYAVSSSSLPRYSYIVNNTGYDAFEAENIPSGELALASGMEIEASDGKVGKLDELVLDSESGEITHLLMLTGHLWGKKEVAVPVSKASSTDGGIIHLKIDKKAVGELPTIPLEH